MDHITEGHLVSKNFFKTMLVSKDLPFLYSSTEKILLIYAIYPKLSRITCYPINNRNTIWVLRLKFEKLSQNQVFQYHEIIKKYDIHHTTGIQEKKSAFFIESYFSSDDENFSPEKLKQKLIQLPGLSFQEIESISFEGK